MAPCAIADRHLRRVEMKTVLARVGAAAFIVGLAVVSQHCGGR
jgi:hypothetical protein